LPPSLLIAWERKVNVGVGRPDIGLIRTLSPESASWKQRLSWSLSSLHALAESDWSRRGCEARSLRQSAAEVHGPQEADRLRRRKAGRQGGRKSLRIEPQRP
jgi:hypothetical protein